MVSAANLQSKNVEAPKLHHKLNNFATSIERHTCDANFPRHPHPDYAA
ncbi:hypothetical protein M7I_4758 [Glarea lozoyensis 74030]|uniref:Uncharacterized protein n=1 Tax=Glarea lozoyensis (strain ATCC 74030 / MF5533) TaxID=1104152 RepID=H0EQ15_GLAL7|nr:hypothetical protein M7I_4758 [Glarea lozoyensis 74030]